MNKPKLSAKDYLSQAYRIDQRINSKIEQVQSLRELAGKASATLSDVPPSNVKKKCRRQMCCEMKLRNTSWLAAVMVMSRRRQLQIMC